MNNRLLQEVTDRLEYHLNQVCDPKACETPEHEVTRQLIDRARRPRVTDVEIYVNDFPQPRPVVVLPPPETYMRSRGG